MEQSGVRIPLSLTPNGLVLLILLAAFLRMITPKAAIDNSCATFSGLCHFHTILVFTVTTTFLHESFRYDTVISLGCKTRSCDSAASSKSWWGHAFGLRLEIGWLANRCRTQGTCHDLCAPATKVRFASASGPFLFAARRQTLSGSTVIGEHGLSKPFGKWHRCAGWLE